MNDNETIKNYTGEIIKLKKKGDDNKFITLLPEGNIILEPIGSYVFINNFNNPTMVRYNNETVLPEKIKGVYYLVPDKILALYHGIRKDFYVAHDPIYNKKGEIIGYNSITNHVKILDTD